ncbi:MAG: PaaI family thioesterase [Dethiobacter sp.]|jgi:acyl-CoA thioesterase|nr:PaaI family thioesterase [Dethiobacter sp.]
MTEAGRPRRFNPYWELLGISVVRWETGFARLVMPVKKDLLQVYGLVHGGAIASLIDSSIAVALTSGLAPGESASTVELKVNYLAPVLEGKIFADTRIVKRGKTIVVGITEVVDEEGRMVAIGTATYMILRNNSSTPERKEDSLNC